MINPYGDYSYGYFPYRTSGRFWYAFWVILLILLVIIGLGYCYYNYFI